MGSAIGIPTTRVSDLFIRERLLNQIKFDQIELFKSQSQMSTGRRFQLPSEDPNAALRVMSLQRLLERKKQIQTNLATNQSYLSASDATLGNVASILNDVRATALGVVGTTATDAQRAAAAQQVDQAIRQMVDTGNQKFRGRYLFAGSETSVSPFEKVSSGSVRYSGNEGHLSSYADINLLFESNLTGNEVFGAISEPVRGTADLNPIVTFNTRLADLRNGQGIAKGSIAVSDGSKTSIVDLSKAETIGDVAAMIRAHPPQGRILDVAVTSRGLWLKLDPGVPPVAGNLTVREVGGGTTADELGILAETGVGYDPLVGEDLNPIIRSTTRLADILGTRASAVVRSGGPDNDLIFEADDNGEALNGVAISFIDDGTVSAGHEVPTYDPVHHTLVINIQAGFTTAKDVIAAVNHAHDDLGTVPFSARIDPLEDVSGGAGFVAVSAAATAAGGSGIVFDKTSGLQIVNGDATHVISFANAETVEDVLNILNMSDAGVLAEINQTGTGIDVRSRLSGTDFMIGENGGTTAAELGLRSMTAQTRLEDLNFGRGVHDNSSLGVPASATYVSSGTDNDLIFTARNAEPDWNGFTINFVDSAAHGSETIDYQPAAKTLTFGIAAGQTTANELISLFQGSAANADFEISLDANDGNPNQGNNVLQVGPATTTSGGLSKGADFTITRADGVMVEIDVAGAETIGDVLQRINDLNPPAVPGDPPPLVARLAAYGNGIELVDNTVGPGTLTVTRTNLSNAAFDLGLIPRGQESRSASGGTPGVLTGADTHPLETNGIFTALLRLQTALQQNNMLEVQRAVETLDQGALRLSFGRAELGARQQALDVLKNRQEDENVELQDNLSKDFDVDFAEAVSNFNGRQIAFEAALKSTAAIFGMTLLDYL